MQLSIHYHNTNGLTTGLSKANRKAYKLEHQIYEFMSLRRGVKMTPWEVHQHFQSKLITSVRRALSNLVRDNLLKDTKVSKEMKQERQGKPNYMWYYE